MKAYHLPVRVDFKSDSRDFWKRYHEFRRVRQHESRPDDPLRPDELEEKQLMRESAFDIRYRYEFTQDGRLLGWLSGSTSKPGTPGHDSNKHLFWADLYVRPDARRRGIGTSFMALLLELMDAHGCTIVGIGTEDDSGHAFLKWLGAEAKLSGAENRLKLADVDWKMVDRWAIEGPRRSPATRLEIYDGPLPEGMWNDYAPQLSSMLNGSPESGRMRKAADWASGSRPPCSRIFKRSTRMRAGSQPITRVRTHRCWRSTRSLGSSSFVPPPNIRSAATTLPRASHPCRRERAKAL